MSKQGTTAQAPKLNFVEQLYDMLSNPEYHHIISWYYDDRSFIVHDIDCLVEAVFPKYFNHTVYASFARQLINYGFRKVTEAGAHVYSQRENLFRRDDPSLLHTILRRDQKNRKRLAQENKKSKRRRHSISEESESDLMDENTASSTTSSPNSSINESTEITIDSAIASSESVLMKPHKPLLSIIFSTKKPSVDEKDLFDCDTTWIDSFISSDSPQTCIERSSNL
jgi:hypothetical protein